MSSILSDGEGSARQRRRLTGAIRESLRELSVQLSVLNHQVGTRVELKDADVGCLDLIARKGPLSPSALARSAGLHPATLTGVLDRLERGGWVARDRDPADRRAVLVRALRQRNSELLGLYAGMNASLERICAGYDEGQLQVIGEFLQRVGAAGSAAAAELASGGG